MDVRREEFICGKRVEKLRTENLEARRLAQISVPKDTGCGLSFKAWNKILQKSKLIKDFMFH
jgi:hypothetical protein